MDEAAEKSFREKEQRLRDAVELREPDHVPVFVGLNYHPAKLARTEAWDAYYDFPAWRKAYVDAARYYQPDRLFFVPNQSGLVLEAIGARQLCWPGHGVSRKSTHQFVEGEYMKADEYDHFLNDTSDFLVRRYLPRVYGILEPASKLPPLNTLMGRLPFHTFADPVFAEMMEKMAGISREAVEWQKQIFSLMQELIDLGLFIRQPMFMVGAPFDAISDFLRGMRGAMLDMYRQPEKVKAACEMMCRIELEWIAQAGRAKEFTPAFMALHRGAHGFMSLEQFEEFYWPYLLKVIRALVDFGYTPDVFFEGDYNSRLEYLTQMPHGKVIARFDQIDMRRAKEVLGGKICIAGNMPVSILQLGTPEDVKEKVRELVDVAGKDGGYIMAPASALDEVKPKNLKTMIDYTKEYGRYR